MRRQPSVVASTALAMLVSLIACSGNAPSSTSSQPATTNNSGSSGVSSGTSIYWTAPAIGSVNTLGEVTWPATGQGSVTLLSPKITGNGGSLVCASTSWNTAGTQLTITYNMGTTTVHVTVQVQGGSSGIQAQLTADRPVITSVDMGSWATNLATKAIAVPYYTGDIWYAQGLSEYVNAWWDWHTTQATRLNGTAAQYFTKTDGTLNALDETLAIVASTNVDAVLPATGNPASPYMPTLAGRLVLEIWDAGFYSIQQGLADLGDYGISNCIGIIHDWQNQGYDNALPLHYSANAEFGGSSGIQAAIAQGASNGCLMGVHENYIDYYPNYPQFTANAVALNSDGTQMDSWLNPTTGIQSFSAKPSWMVTNASTQSPIIHQAYGTTADYIDVLSAAPISSHGDMDASSPGAGMLSTWMAANQSLWTYERKTHNGPVFGEGADHWYYSGLLDGVEAQLGAGSVSANSDASLPLFADFDLLSIHPLEVNHGMGYYERWTTSGTETMTTTQMDAYRTQEIAFGHAPFLSDGTWSDVPHAFVESNLVSPVATSYGQAQASSIQYQVNGSWVTSSVAAQSETFTQLQVVYNNGLTVVANAAPSSLAWNGLTIPQYGWAAKGNNLLAYTAVCGSTVCDYAQTATSIFANSRNQADAEIGWGYAAPSVAALEQGSGNTFAITYAWQVYRPLGTEIDYKVFVHFVDDSEVTSTDPGIIFQNDHFTATPTSQWAPGQSVSDGPWTVAIPSSVQDGTYSIRIGIFDPTIGNRLELSGNNDGTNRYIIGYLTISGSGSQVSFKPPPAPANDPRLNAAGSVVNFGTVQTDGMISITQGNGQWILRPVPRDRNFTVLLNTANFPEPTIVQATGDTNSTVVPTENGTYWQLPLNGSKSYSWPVN
jgi:Family of unknown function (DUF5696)